MNTDQKNHLQRAIFYMIISTMAFAVMNGLVKYLGEFTSYQLVFFRSLGTLIITMTLLKRKKISIWGNKKVLLITRGVAGAISLLLFFMSLKYIPVGTSVTLRYMAPIFAAFFAVVWLKEKIKPLQWLFFIVAFCGVLIVKGFDPSLSITGVLLAIASSVMMGFVFVGIVAIGKQDHPLVVVNYFMAIGVILGGLLSIGSWRNPAGIEWILLIAIGLVGYVGQLYMTKSFQMATTSSVTPFKYLEVLFTALIGVIWFQETYTLAAVLGIVLILSSLIGNMFYKNQA